MSDTRNPKEQFLEELRKITCHFEKVTGVSVHNINFPDRLDNTELDDIGKHTVMTRIKFELQ